MPTMMPTTKKLSYWIFLLLLGAAYCLPIVVPDLLRQPLAGWKDCLIMLGYYGVVVVPQVALLLLLSLNRWVFAVVFPIYALASAIMLWFFLTLKVVVSPTVVELVLTNDAATSADFITTGFCAAMAATAGIAIFFVWLRWARCGTPQRPVAWAAAGLAVVVLVGATSVSRVRDMLETRIPFSLFASVKTYLTNRQEILEERHAFDNVEAQAEADTINVVFVLGESLRADHLSLNGYHRPTTPLLEKERNLVSLANVRTEAFHTALSVPRILTRATDDEPDAAYTEPSFITLFNKAGFSTAWIANQEPLPQFISLVSEADTVVNAFTGHSLYMYDYWLDTDLLPHFANIIAGEAPRKLLVLHAIGSHWWTKAHYTPDYAHFLPDLDSRNIGSNTQEQIINSYDNCALFTDMFLSRVIGQLRGGNNILFYLSDHGEGLGEEGIFLHGVQSTGTANVAAMVWWSDEYEARYPEKINALRGAADDALTPAYLFHTLLSAGTITSPAVFPTLDLTKIGKFEE